MRLQLEQAFQRHFHHAADFVVRAPGRVNLIGEHTDYNQGLVLPCAINYETLVAVRPRPDNRIQVVALDWEEQTDQFELALPIAHHSTQQWSNYVRGVVSELLGGNHGLIGCDLAISGNVPQGAGLSSSAALEVGLALGLLHAAGKTVSPLELARIGQAAENNFVGCACGIMDQLISAAGVAGGALAIDCRDLHTTPVPIPASLSILMINSNVKRGLVDSEYNIRRQQCESAAEYFGASSLRDVSLDQLEAAKGLLGDAETMRARHVIEENQRVTDFVKALTEYDLPAVSRLMADSHRSMRDQFEITTPEIDLLVDVLTAVCGDRGGARMTGGGFGGCVVALMESELVEPAIKAVEARYQRETGLSESIYLSRPCSGASVIG